MGCSCIGNSNAHRAWPCDLSDPTPVDLALLEGEFLDGLGLQVADADRYLADVFDLVTVGDDVALAYDEVVVAHLQEDLLGLAAGLGEAVEFERNRRWRARGHSRTCRRHGFFGGLSEGRMRSCALLRQRGQRAEMEEIAARSGVFAGAQLGEKLKMQRGIEADGGKRRSGGHNGRAGGSGRRS